MQIEKQKSMFQSTNNIISSSFNEKILEKKKTGRPRAKNF